MKPLAIELTKGKKRQLQSVGWKTPKENAWRQHFFALSQDGKPLVIKLKAAMPDFYDPLHQARAVFSCEPFPEAVCVEISPCRLLPPPCYKSRKDFEGQLPCHPAFDPWKSIYWQTHHQALFLEPADEAPLKERLDKWLAAMRKAYEHEAGTWRDRIKQVTTATLQELGFSTEKQRAKRLAELQGQLDIVESEDSIVGVPCKGRLKLTLEEVKRGHEGIRDAWMHEDWAAKNGWDLDVMRRARRAFLRWLETHTGTPAIVHDSSARERRKEIAPPRFGEKYEQDPRFLEACASVRYRARFADNAKTVVYLGECELPKELMAEERDGVARLREVVDLQAAKEPPPWHSDDWREVYLHDQTGQRKDKATLHNALRALCLLLKDDIGKAKPFTEIEPQIGARAGSLDKEDNVDPPSPDGPRRIYDLLRTTAGKQLAKWGVLVISGAREKFIKLSPPRAK